MKKSHRGTEKVVQGNLTHKKLPLPYDHPRILGIGLR